MKVCKGGNGVKVEERGLETKFSISCLKCLYWRARARLKEVWEAARVVSLLVRPRQPPWALGSHRRSRQSLQSRRLPAPRRNRQTHPHRLCQRLRRRLLTILGGCDFDGLQANLNWSIVPETSCRNLTEIRLTWCIGDGLGVVWLRINRLWLVSNRTFFFDIVLVGFHAGEQRLRNRGVGRTGLEGPW